MNEERQKKLEREKNPQIALSPPFWKECLTKYLFIYLGVNLSWLDAAGLTRQVFQIICMRSPWK
jgi:hypothetical protein